MYLSDRTLFHRDPSVSQMSTLDMDLLSETWQPSTWTTSTLWCLQVRETYSAEKHRVQTIKHFKFFSFSFLGLPAGGVGFDINCGVRLLRTNLDERDVQPVKEQLAQSLFDHIPVGVGSKGVIPMGAK